MSESVLDASVIIAILKNERIDDSAYSLVDGGVMSAVNVAEVYTKLAELDMISAPRVDLLLSSLSRIVPFSMSQARITGRLRGVTRHVGLSLGDRACLALAIELGGIAYTTEERWTRANAGCEVRLLR